jgi:microcystin degradation protein MlrC
MRIFTASFGTETNTFSPIPTDYGCFERGLLARPGDHPETPTLCSAVMMELRKLASSEGLNVFEGTTAWADPGGLLQRETYEAIRDEILDQLRAALPVEAVVVGLHGAMVAQGYDDCEGDLLERVREIAGDGAVIAACLDPHSHLTAKRVAAADILAAFHEFPHTDFVERAEHVVGLTLRAVRGEIKPLMSVFDCRMIDVYPTSQQPMRSFIDRLSAYEGRGAILSVSLIHGFMAADVPEMGTQMLVVSDGDAEAGSLLAHGLGMELFALRGRTSMSQLDIEAAFAKVRDQAGQGVSAPVIVADIWDNPGGGVPGDGTHVLRALLVQGLPAALAPLWDPIAVSNCRAAGRGAELRLRIGGKSGPDAGEPVDVLVEVRNLVEDLWQSFGSSRVSMGAAAVVRPLGTEVDVLLTSNRAQAFEPDILTNAGVDPSTKVVVVVKSTNHFFAGFRPIAKDIVYVAAPSFYPTDPAVTSYRKVTRQLWPRVADPHGVA